MAKLLTRELFRSFRNDVSQLQDASWEEEEDNDQQEQGNESFPDYLTMNPAEIPPFLLQEEEKSPLKERPPLLLHSAPEEEDIPETQETEIAEETLQNIQAEVYTASITMRLIDDLFHQQLVEFKDKENPLTPLLEKVVSSNFESDFDQEFGSLLNNKLDSPLLPSTQVAEDDLEEEEQLLENFIQEQEKLDDVPLSSFRLQNEIFKSELQKCKVEYNNLLEQEMSKSMAIERLKQEIQITQQCIEQENQSFLILQQSLDAISEKMSHQSTIRQYEQEPTASLTLNILQFSNTLQHKSEELKNKIETLFQLEEEKRTKQIQCVHSEDMYKQKLIHEEKWAQESLQLEKNAQREVNYLTRDVEEKRKKLEIIIKALDFIKYDEDFVIRSFERLIQMLKGKEELPNNNYISVKKAIFLYSKLKDATNRNILNREYINQLLKENIEFNILLPLSETQSVIDQLIREEEETSKRKEEEDNIPQNQQVEELTIQEQQQQQQQEEELQSENSSKDEEESSQQLQQVTKRKMSEKLQFELHSMDRNKVNDYLEDDDSILSDESLQELQEANQAIAKFTLISPQILRNNTNKSTTTVTTTSAIIEEKNDLLQSNSSGSSSSIDDEEDEELEEQYNNEEEEDSNEEDF